MARTRVDQIIKAYHDGMGNMAPLHSLTRVLARYFSPSYADLTMDPSASEIALPNTSAGIKAQQTFVSGLYSNTISMGKGTIESADPTLRDEELAKRYYGKVGEKGNDIVRVIFPKAYREMLDDMALSSVGVIYIHFDDETNEHEVLTYNPADCVWYEDHSGKVNKMYRGFEYTADQAVGRFGLENVGEKVRKAYNDDSKANTKFKFIHCVRPRKDRKAMRKDNLNMPYESIYICEDDKQIVEESGYLNFRYVVNVMMKRRGLKSGTSPAMNSLPSMRTLVRGIDDFLDAVEFKTNPVLFMNDRESVDNAKSLKPGDVRYAKLGEKPFLYGEGGDPASVDALNERMREEIRELHFADLFQALEEFKQGQRTAYEISQIIAEKIGMVAPIVHPIKETFADVYDIIASDIINYKLIDVDVPDILRGDQFRVRYTSRIDSRVSGVETENLLFAIEEVAKAEQLMQTPETKALFKSEEVYREVLDARNIKPDLSRTTDEYQEELDRMAQESQQAMMAQADAKALSKRNVNQAPDEGSEAQAVIDQAKAEASL